jgi:DNA-directed RNA polymerase subunit RPC12/RpoP
MRKKKKVLPKRAYWKPIYNTNDAGHEIEMWKENRIMFYQCSKCLKEPLYNQNGEEVLSKFCPFCGERMY